MTYEYFANRSLQRLEPPFTGAKQDALFAAERPDTATFSSAIYRHCTFANISFKEAKITQSRFVNCVFVSCYFRKTTILDSCFEGCVFIRCNFTGTELASCTFFYTSFESCFLPYDTIEPTFPSNPYLAEMLATNLAVEAHEAGATIEARRFRLLAIKSRERHLLFASRGGKPFQSSDRQTFEYYQRHYPGNWERFVALRQWCQSRLNDHLWGYGEKGMGLFRNFVVAAFLVFPGAYYALRGSFRGPTGRLSEYVFFSIESILPSPSLSALSPTAPVVKTVSAGEALFGLIVGGLFVSLLLRAILRR